MAQRAIAARGLPAEPLAAAAAFHAGPLTDALAALAAGDDVALLFDPADHAHAAWRTAAVQSLARAHAPERRCNAVAGVDGAEVQRALAYLAGAAGVTGQVLIVDAIPGSSA